MNKGEVYQNFGQRIAMFLEGRRLGIVESRSNNTQAFDEHLVDAYQSSHLYSIDEDTKKLLMLTKPPKNTQIKHLPHDQMFIDVNFSKEEIKQFTNIDFNFDYVKGFMITTGIMESTDGIQAGNCIRITALLTRGEWFEFSTFHYDVELFDEYKSFNVVNDGYDAKAKKFLKNFSLNLMNLILDPEIIVVERKADKSQNEKRIKRGKMPFPDSTVLRIDGQRRKYIGEMVDKGHLSCGYAFFVRGHWRKLESDRYKNKGKTWVVPYVKGKGLLVKKEYEVNVNGQRL